MKIWHLELSKIAQSGHTDHNKEWVVEAKSDLFFFNRSVAFKNRISRAAAAAGVANVGSCRIHS